jgi:hypothetical protein
MNMSRKKLDTNAAAHQLRELRRRREEIDQQIEAVEAAIKSEMDARRVDELSGGVYVTFEYDRSIRFRSQNVRGDNAVVYAVFFD